VWLVSKTVNDDNGRTGNYERMQVFMKNMRMQCDAMGMMHDEMQQASE
jgi:hypothetical protein